MVITFVVERAFTLRQARGRGSMISFLKTVRNEINSGNIKNAIAACEKQHGSCANVLRAGLETFQLLKQSGRSGHIDDQKQTAEEIQSSIDESMMLEVPLLEKNLVALSTIASIAVLVGLLGTTIGMIRAFKALAHSGAPDAIQLSLGISEALVNTAGGLITAIMGIVFYNYFVTKIDNFTYMINEESYSMVRTLARSLGIDNPGEKAKAK